MNAKCQNVAGLLAIGFTRDRNQMPSSSRNIVQSSEREHGRGRLASAPSEIPARGWKEILLRVWNNIGEDRVMLVAAGVTYYCLAGFITQVG
jgi:membrane protein